MGRCHLGGHARAHWIEMNTGWTEDVDDDGQLKDRRRNGTHQIPTLPFQLLSRIHTLFPPLPNMVRGATHLWGKISTLEDALSLFLLSALRGG